MPSTTIGRGNMLYDFIIATTLTPSSVTNATSAEQTFTVKGLLTTDFVDVQCSGAAQTSGIVITNCRVSAADTLALTFGNFAASPATPVSSSYQINVSRAENLPLPVNAL